jgi:dipeptidyl aminopeptidase/acylaminoacyl peptidase
MPEPQIAPYGSWRSPITTDLIVAQGVSIGQVARDGADVYWIEQRPAEGGRNVVVRRTPDGTIADVTPSPFNARTRVHEYGGGAFAVADGVVYFANFADQRLYRQVPGQVPTRLTEAEGLRYADAVVDRRRQRLIAVREDHTVPGREAVNTIASVDLERGTSEVLVSGSDFYAAPRLSPDGNRLAWLTWNHPNMPWDGTELWLAEVAPNGGLHHAERIAGGREESIAQPEWSPDGTLYFVSDRSGWWNLYRWGDRQVQPVFTVAAELAGPAWVFGLSTYGFAAPEQLVCTYSEAGARRLAVLNPATGATTYLETPYTEIREVHPGPGEVTFVGGSPTEAPALVQVELKSGQLTVLRRSSTTTVDPAYLSRPQAIEFPTEGGRTAYGYYYPPTNPDAQAPAGEKPPLVVFSHGGPTSATSTTLNWQIQYWTSRGFAILDVNYGGSSGYGRAYRQRLNGQWGVVDVDDCANGARYLVERGLVDGNRLAIRGGSAGGYTTLAALTFRDVFKAGASYYGVSDVEALARDTHKFESRYMDSMVGPYPERQDLYRERSPLQHTERLSCPIIFFQGLEDKIVPPNQAEMMVAALRAKKLPVAYLAFEGEQHGFRRAETIQRTLEAELYFYSRIFGFPLAEPVAPVPIENL